MDPITSLSAVKQIDHTSNKTGSPGFHGKYTSKTQSNKPTERTDKYTYYKHGKENYRYVPIVLGFALRADNIPHINDKSPYPSYAKIETETTVKTGSDQVDHKIKINPDHSVNLDNRLIASAPGNKTKAQKEKFCKAVVWSLLNDPSCLEDKLKEISGIIADDKPIVLETIPEKVTLEQITGYPEFKHFDDLKLSVIEKSDLIEANYSDPLDEGYDNHEYDNIETEYNTSYLVKEMWTTIKAETIRSHIPVFPAGYLPWLKVTISEVPA